MQFFGLNQPFPQRALFHKEAIKQQMELHWFSVAMALVFPLMDCSGPEFNVSLTYFFLSVGCLSSLSLSGQEVMYGTFQSAYHIIQVRGTPSFSSLPGDGEGKTDQQQHFIHREITVSVYQMASIPIHVPRAPGALPRSVRACLLSTHNTSRSIQGAEDMKCKRKDARCSQLSRVSRPADSASSIYLPPFSISS